jgi:Transposase DDE domain
MYVDISSLRRNGKTYTRYLLRECYREEGKVKHRTIANLSQCSPQEIEAVRLALRHKQELAALGALKDSVQLHQGPAIGAVWLVYQVARHLGIEPALGPSRQGRLALWQVIARVIDQGSRLSAVRLAATHAACDVLGLKRFDEEDLYGNLDWLSVHQAEIEDRLFQLQPQEPASGRFLYDVTSSYLEGEHNELGAFGYNRDGKRGKRQLVIGLVCNGGGRPLSIEVFAGNTQDPKTFTPQVKKVAKRFGGREITFVGDRGLIKSQQIEALGERQFHYITAITKPQIEALLKSEVLQLDLFDKPLPKSPPRRACATSYAATPTVPRRSLLPVKTNISDFARRRSNPTTISQRTLVPRWRWPCACLRTAAKNSASLSGSSSLSTAGRSE